MNSLDNRELNKITEMQKIIQYIDQAIAVSLSFDGLIANVLTAITANGQWAISCYWDVDFKTDENLNLLSLHSLSPENFSDFINITRQITFKKGEGLPGSVQSLKSPVWIYEIAKSGNFPRKVFALKNGIQGGMAFPVMIKDTLIGVIELFSENVLGNYAGLDSDFMGIGSRIGQAVSKLKAEQQFKHEQKRFQDLLQAVSDSVCVSITNVRGDIIVANKMFVENSGFPIEKIVGASNSIFNSGIHPKEFFIELWNTILSGNVWKGNICNKKEDGSLYWVAKTITPIKNENGEIQYLAIQHDITLQKSIENRLLASEEIWKLALGGTCDGVWDWDVSNGKMTVSKNWQDLMGYFDQEMFKDYEEWKKYIHPDDLTEFISDMHFHFEGKCNYYNERRMRCKDGTYKWILDRSILTNRDSNGTPIRIVGIYSDIDDIKKVK